MKKPTLYSWTMDAAPVETVLTQIKAMPESLQPWVGRLVWWDRYSDKQEPVTGFESWLTMRNPDPDPHELMRALIQIGYTRRYAEMRAGVEKWMSVKNRPKGPGSLSLKAPPETQFPIQLAGLVSVYRCFVKNVERYNVFPRAAARKKLSVKRKCFFDFYSAMDCALDLQKKCAGL